MQSKSKRFPNGLGNDSGELGHNIMDHHFQIGADGSFDGFHDKYYTGRQMNLYSKVSKYWGKNKYQGLFKRIWLSRRSKQNRLVRVC